MDQGHVHRRIQARNLLQPHRTPRPQAIATEKRTRETGTKNQRIGPDHRRLPPLPQRERIRQVTHRPRERKERIRQTRIPQTKGRQAGDRPLHEKITIISLAIYFIIVYLTFM